MDNAVQTGDIKFTRIEFLAYIQSIWKQAFKKLIVLSSFCKTGLTSLNPQKVFNKLPPPPTNTISDSTQLPVTLFYCTTQEMRSHILITIYDLQYQAIILENSDYLPFIWTDI